LKISHITMKQFYHFLFIFFLVCFTSKLYSQSVPSYVPTNGLVGWWGFNGNAQDGSGNGNHGTVNGATLTIDRFGNQNGAYSFDGVNDNILIQSLNNIQYLPITYSTWINLNSFNTINYPLGGGMVIVGRDWSGNYNQGALMIFDYPSIGITNRISYYIGQTNSNTSYTPNLNQWIQIVMTLEMNDTIKFYVNSNLIFQEYFPTSSNVNAPFRFGAGSEPNFNLTRQHFNGKLDDIGIWNRALTQQEITNLYNSQLLTQTSLCLPTITTSTPTSIGIDSVIVGGNITNDGGSSIVLRGVCYSTTPNPNMGNMRTEDGSGGGSFSTILRNLNPSTTYYVRSYAKNTNGVVVYGDEVSINTMSTPLIGSNYAGGIVFYVDSTGAHGLVCAPYDLGNWLLGEYYWGCYGLDIQNTSTNVGSGAINTLLITAGCTQRPIAASVCADFVLNGYSDWYLPSLGELQLIFNNLHSQGIGGLSGYLYWSSSQSIPDGAWIMLFNNPNGGLGSVINHTKDYGASVRPTRTF
jgi:hypothetical protein